MNPLLMKNIELRCLAFLCLLSTLTIQAQHTIYGVKRSGAFVQNKQKFELNEGDALEFQNMRYYTVDKEGARQGYLYTTADTFYVEDPGIGVYRPNYLRNNNFDDEKSQYCWSRSKQSDHFVVFWEPEFGSDPTQAPEPYTFNPDDLLERAEKAFVVYTTQLGFSKLGNSKTLDSNKIIMLVHYTDVWRATGSGVDNRVGTLDVNPAAANTTITTAHEIGHTFQYIVGCDEGTQHGWRYGFGPNASGGCGWWESCAQWQAFKVYPEQQFTSTWANPWKYAHLNLLHEEWRYYNFFVQDYWCELHGADFIGRLWKESTYPEDPVETYQRMNNASQADFCRDMYNYATRAITWDIEALRTAGRRYTDRFETSLHNAGDGWWQVDSAQCPQNYGFNVIRLRVPAAGTVVKASFKGIAGAKGYRAYQVDKAGWRYGFVALQSDGTRVYGDMYADAEGTAEMTIPAETTNLWFVVSGAPTEHFRHAWEMGTDEFGNDVHTPATLSNDEQWPYQVRFTGTNLPGQYYYPADYPRTDIIIDEAVTLKKTGATGTNVSSVVNLPMEQIYDALGLSTELVGQLTPGANEPANLRLRALNADGNESDSRLLSSQYYWGFNASGDVVEGTVASTNYLLTLNYAKGKVIVNGYRSRISVGTTYQAALEFIFINTDGKAYTATIHFRVKVE